MNTLRLGGRKESLTSCPLLLPNQGVALARKNCEPQLWSIRLLLIWNGEKRDLFILPRMNFNTGSPAQPPADYPPQTLSLGFLQGKQELFWIAGLSLVNSLLAEFNANLRFPTDIGET